MQEQQQEKEQEIEIEKFADLQYSRTNEKSRAWVFRDILHISPEHLKPFYQLNQFSLFNRNSLKFPFYIGASTNFYNLDWDGERRVKNVIMVLDVVPNCSLFKEYRLDEEAESSPEIEAHVTGMIHSLFTLAGYMRTMTTAENEIQVFSEVITSVFEGYVNDELSDRSWLANKGELIDIVKKSIAMQGFNAVSLRKVIFNTILRRVNEGRYMLAVSLAEAETIRRMIHLRADKQVIDGGTAQMCFRHLPDFDKEMDQSTGYSRPSEFQMQSTRSLLRFFDGDNFFTNHQLLLLLHGLINDRVFERQIFF